jgi:lysozyme
MKTSANGIALIKDFEGFRSSPYLCSGGVATIGYGATFYADGRRVTLQDDPITEPQADKLLRDTLVHFENIVKKRLTVSVNQNQFDALVSHTFNTGGSATLFRLVNQRDFAKAASWMETTYTTAKGKVLQGLVRRRKKETELFLTAI